MTHTPSPPSSGAPPAVWFAESLPWVFRFRDQALALTTREYERYGPVAIHRFGPFKPLVSLYGPDATRYVLLNRDENLSAKRAWEYIMGRIFGGGLMLRDADDHRYHRRIMQTAFKKEALQYYVEEMNPRISARIDRWIATATEAPFRALPAYKHLTLDLASSVFIGIELGAEATKLNEAFEATVAASMSVLRLPIPGLEFDRGLQGRRHMSRFFGGLIAERRAGDGADMLSRLCNAESEEGERFTDEEIVDHMNFLMMAAHDTTTSTLTSLTYLLAKHPQWQERIREESRALGPRPLAFEDQDELTALTQAIYETLRLYPPLSTIPRVALDRFEINGFEIPAGAMVAVYPIHTHRMHEWWSEPDRFDPDRFAEHRSEHKRHSHSFVPFGGGAHMCLGMVFAEMQIRAIVHQLIQRVRWSVPDGYEMPVQEAPISKPIDELPLRLASIAG